RKARQAAPSIIFFDEIDSITPVRGKSFDSGVTERMISQFLAELDGLEELKGVVVIAATNRPDMIDPALLRPGRFDKIIRIGLPRENGRLQILKIHTKNIPLAEDVNLEELSRRTEKFSGAELASLCHEAVLLAIQEYLPSVERSEESYKENKVAMSHLEFALSKIIESRKSGRISPAEKLEGMQQEIDRLAFH
ncbi:MAG: AAA family ATPase, partial [Candidatus Hodarchaeales archaeon]